MELPKEEGEVHKKSNTLQKKSHKIIVCRKKAYIFKIINKLLH